MRHDDVQAIGGAALKDHDQALVVEPVVDERRSRARQKRWDRRGADSPPSLRPSRMLRRVMLMSCSLHLPLKFRRAQQQRCNDSVVGRCEASANCGIACGPTMCSSIVSCVCAGDVAGRAASAPASSASDTDRSVVDRSIRPTAGAISKLLPAIRFVASASAKFMRSSNAAELTQTSALVE